MRVIRMILFAQEKYPENLQPALMVKFDGKFHLSKHVIFSTASLKIMKRPRKWYNHLNVIQNITLFCIISRYFWVKSIDTVVKCAPRYILSNGTFLLNHQCVKTRRAKQEIITKHPVKFAATGWPYLAHYQCAFTH